MVTGNDKDYFWQLRSNSNLFEQFNHKDLHNPRKMIYYLLCFEYKI